jgi:hypothetical protein
MAPARRTTGFSICSLDAERAVEVEDHVAGRERFHHRGEQFFAGLWVQIHRQTLGDAQRTVSYSSVAVKS